MKKTLITGISGFVGSHLAEHLFENNYDIYGFSHPKHQTNNLDKVIKNIHLENIDLQSEEKVNSSFKKNKFELIFHLAAFSSPSQSFLTPQETLVNNIVSQVNILEAASKYCPNARILIVGSCDEYGNVEEKHLPIKESAPLNPNSPYAVSKIAQDYLGLQYYGSHKLNIVRVRPFNHTGPRQSHVFAIPSFASQIAQLEKNHQGVLKVGDLTSQKDYTDVRDIVKAYLLALEKGEPGEVYNIGSGNLYKIEDILNKLLSFTEARIKIEEDKSLIRKKEITKIVCDFSKFREKTGWKPEISIDKTLFDTIEFERSLLN